MTLHVCVYLILTITTLYLQHNALIKTLYYDRASKSIKILRILYSVLTKDGINKQI